MPRPGSRTGLDSLERVAVALEKLAVAQERAAAATEQLVQLLTAPAAQGEPLEFVPDVPGLGERFDSFREHARSVTKGQAR